MSSLLAMIIMYVIVIENFNTNYCYISIDNANYDLKWAINDLDERYLQSQAINLFYQTYKTGLYELEKDDEIESANSKLHFQLEEIMKIADDTQEITYNELIALF